MEAALLALLEALIDATPSIITSVSALLSRKQQEYASVLASVQAADADTLAELEKS